MIRMKSKIKNRFLFILMFFVAIVSIASMSETNINAATIKYEKITSVGTTAYYVNRTTGASKSSGVGKIYLDGVVAFCVEPGVRFYSGSIYNSTPSVSFITESEKELINKYIHFSSKTDVGYLAAQALVWDVVGWTTTYKNDNDAIQAEMQRVKNLVSAYDKLPSINGQTIQVKEGLTGGSLTDLNGVLSNYKVTGNTSDAKVSIQGNKLSATLPAGSKDGGTITLSREVTQIGKIQYFWFKNGEQTVVTEGNVTPKTITVNVKRNPLTPKIGTVAKDKESNSKTAHPVKNVTIVDTVNYSELTIGKSYTLKGVLMDKSTGSELIVNGAKVEAEKTFTPTSENGSVNLEFTFNANALINKEVVVFERLYSDGKEITTHTDINDTGQTVKFKNPRIGTLAKDNETGSKRPNPEKNVTIVDTVTYNELKPGQAYTLKGVLMDKSTGSELLVNGVKVEAQKTFTPSSENGSVDLNFTFDASALANKEVVVYEYLYLDDGTQVTTHTDINDTGQTVKFKNPRIGTTASDKETGSKRPNPVETVTIVDKVAYVDLKPGEEYVVKGILMDKETNTPLLVNGLEVKAEKTFIPTTENGTVNIEFTFEAFALADKEVVVFERLYRDNIEIATHADINDVGQTVKFKDPKIGTTASDKETATKEPSPEKDVTIVDTVAYVDLKPGQEYVMKGVLMDKLTGEPVLVDGKEVTAEKTFIPTNETGTVEIEFTFDAYVLAGKEVVVFERLYCSGYEVTTHTDINDEGQTVKFKDPQIGTTATEKNSGTKEFDADDKITVIDVVSYEDLIVGKEYTIKGILMCKETNEPLLVKGKTVESEITFIPEEAAGTVEIEFTFDAYALGGQELVVFEDLYRKGNLVISHADINDLNQTVKVREPEIKTKAKDKATGSKNLEYGEPVTIVDVVTYKGLIVGKKYTIEGILMRKDTNKPLLVKGKKITARKTFIPKSKNGSVELEFKLNTTDLAGVDVVVFEKLYRRNILVATHTDINDDDQTVTVTPPTPPTGVDTTLIQLSIILSTILTTGYFVYNRKKI